MKFSWANECACHGVVLIVCEGSGLCWGVDQLSVSEDFGLRYLNLRMWCCFGGPASVRSNGF